MSGTNMPYRNNALPTTTRIEVGEFTVEGAFKWSTMDVDGVSRKEGTEIFLASGVQSLTLRDRATFDELSKKRGRRVRLVIEAYDDE